MKLNIVIVYQEAVEFNATVQMRWQYCPSVVAITERMMEVEPSTGGTSDMQVRQGGDEEDRSELQSVHVPSTSSSLLTDDLADPQPGPSTNIDESGSSTSIEESIMPLRTEVHLQ